MIVGIYYEPYDYVYRYHKPPESGFVRELTGIVAHVDRRVSTAPSIIILFIKCDGYSTGTSPGTVPGTGTLQYCTGGSVFLAVQPAAASFFLSGPAAAAAAAVHVLYM